MQNAVATMEKPGMPVSLDHADLMNEGSNLSSENIIGATLYILYYRHGMNTQCQKGFYFKGDFREAVNRAKKHCSVMNYRYIFIRPLICNLDEDEKNRDAAIG